MIPYFYKTPFWLMKWFPSMTWQRSVSSKTLYLTFDDGPIPEVTPYVLEMLSRYEAKATFFCVGDNVRKNPKIFQDVNSAGHSLGNHTFHHLNGWDTSTEKYCEDIMKCEEIMKENGVSPRFFRPPHGRIRKAQRKMVEQQYEVVMWSHLSGDFDLGLNSQQSVKAMRSAAKGSIMVFHDNIKADGNLRKILPEILNYFSNQGFEFKGL